MKSARPSNTLKSNMVTAVMKYYIKESIGENPFNMILSLSRQIKRREIQQILRLLFAIVFIHLIYIFYVFILCASFTSKLFYFYFLLFYGKFIFVCSLFLASSLINFYVKYTISMAYKSIRQKKRNECLHNTLYHISSEFKR